ncbi:hypothetical protein [uncultured Dokdonia sp.]|uniref:hypothetical protein n=1 Tax=uncultured Dokdonia sp. TaxID=575653 RepID=UPI0026142D6A|nr:hypothetical protein [uncultured Dokdonia sp.]
MGRKFHYILYRSNCVEVFIPNGINYGPSPNISYLLNDDDRIDFATYVIGAHPLTDQTSGGTGWKIYPGKPKITICTGYMAATPTILTPLNISLSNIIIARPYRDSNVGCNYTSINVNDFTLYLD